MEIGVFLPLANPIATAEFMQTAARSCEEAGVDSIWVAEHVVLFDQVAPLGDLTIRWVGSEEGDVDVTDEFDVERDVDQQQHQVSRTQDGPERNDR